MEGLVHEFLSDLEQRAPRPEALARLGEPDPARAAEAFRRAAGDPDLAPARARAIWVPALLRSARPGQGALCLEELAQRARAGRGGRLDVGAAPALPRILGSSAFLARLLLRRPDWVSELAGELPAAPCAAPLEADWGAIRLAKYRGLLRIAGRDLLGRPVAASLGELSELAERCLRAALACAGREGDGRDLPALLALGKLGGRELNFSSDVDLLFVYDSPPGAADLEKNQRVARLVRELKSRLEDRSEDGFVYRVDLELRPEGRSGALANSVAAALQYYESFGQEWERQMLIRLRPVAGPPGVGEAFAREVTPFVYRRLIDPGVLQAVRAMKLRIEGERRSAGRDLEADLKEGPGGIRDVEFLVQSLQLFYGGRHPALRTGNVLEALAALGRLSLLPEEAVASLADAYRWLRRAEHALQLEEEQQTAAFPRTPQDRLALARRLGYDAPDGEQARNRLLDDWTAVRDQVRRHFEALVLSERA